MKTKRTTGRLKRPGRLGAEVSATDHMRGSPQAPVTLVGYGDFSNPACGETYHTVRRIQRKMGSQVRYVFRSFPDSDRYSDSQDAAEAAECAAVEGKFWQMHDCLFSSGSADEFHLSRFARGLDLNLGRFRADLKNHVHAAKIGEVRDAGVRSGVTSAPTFFINSVRHESSFGLATLLPAVQAAVIHSGTVSREEAG